jgi:hypothetical protein
MNSTSLAGHSTDELASMIRSGILADNEIAQLIEARKPQGRDLATLMDAARELKGGEIKGRVRTAFRSVQGLTPLPEDRAPTQRHGN